jgi:hypothetical protein
VSGKLAPVIRDICGEYRGAVAHTARGEELDPRCQEARRIYMREYRRRTGQTVSTLYTPQQIADLQADAVRAALAVRTRAHLIRRASRPRVRP